MRTAPGRHATSPHGLPARAGWQAAALAVVLIAPAGCQVFERPVASAGPTLSWLTSLVTAPPEASESFDLTTLKPPAEAPQILPGDLLEITVWDLYEPGQPHT